MHKSPYRLTLLLLTFLLSGCLSEDTQPQGEQSVKGRVVLSMLQGEDYVDAQTRSTQYLTDYTGYTYTFTGTSLIDEHSISLNGDLSDLMNGSPIELEAGNYRLTVSNESAPQTGYGFPTYSGYQDFSVHVDESIPVSISMGTPKNAKLTLQIDESFSTRYGTPTVTFTPSGRNVSLTATGNIAYFPAGTVSYTISASAKSESYVTDITSVPGSLTLTAGCAHTLTLSADPVTGTLIPIISGQHSGPFD